MLGTIVNAAAILVGGAIGLLLKKGIPERVSGGIMQGLGLVVIYIGISGMLKGQNVLIATISIVVGGAIGMILDFDGRFNRFVGNLEQKLASKTDDGSKFSEAFITTTLLYCVGAMAVVGSLNSGLTGNHEVLFTKSILDGVSAVIFASTLGAGVLLSAIPLFLYQGAITLLAQILGTRAQRRGGCRDDLRGFAAHPRHRPESLEGDQDQGAGLHPRDLYSHRACAVHVGGTNLLFLKEK